MHKERESTKINDTDSRAEGIRTYLEDSEISVLRPHQRGVFDDIKKFFEEGGTRGYVSLPTGTGKTVLFVELSKALLASAPERKKPKILVVTPSIDLVHQTMGRSGERGFGRFAPELGVGSYFTDTPQAEKGKLSFLNSEVVVTTYRSFKILDETDEYKYIRIDAKIPHLKMKHIGIERMSISKEDLESHKKGQFSEQLLNSEIYIKMVSLYGEEETSKRIKGWRSYPSVGDLFNSEYYKKLVSLFGEKRALRRIQGMKSYPIIDDLLNSEIYKKMVWAGETTLKNIKQWKSLDDLLNSEIYKEMKELFGKIETNEIVKQWKSYPTIDDLMNSEIFKETARIYGEAETLKKIKQWETFPVIDGLLNSEIYKKMITVFGEAEAVNTIKQWKYYPVIDGLLNSEIYKKMKGFFGRKETVSIIKQWKFLPEKTGRKLLDNFDIIILDEAHHVFGEEPTRIVKSLPEDRLIIGFTATPHASSVRRLENYLPYKIHDLDLKEAIKLGLLASILPVSLKSGLKIEGSDIFDEKGEYLDSKLAYLAQDENRNRIVINAAKALAAQNRGIIISCIAGGEAWHAKHLADMLEKEGVKTATVHFDVPSYERQKIYSKFNKGEIDVITFIGVIGEGWDSERAKVIINARPTRSEIFAVQRVGRITRYNGQTALAIDIEDDFDPQNPPITVADALGIGNTKFGTMIGINQDNNLKEILDSLKASSPIQNYTKAPYTEFKEYLLKFPQLENGFLKTDRGMPDYAIISRVNFAYRGLTDEILEKIGEIRGIEIDKKLGVQGRSVRQVYNIDQARRLLNALPRIDPNKYLIDEEGNKWISSKGLQVLFSKRYPNVTLELIESAITGIQEEVGWMPAVYETRMPYNNRSFNLLKIYNLDQKAINTISEALQNNPIVDKN